MAWENRRQRRYYYRKIREKGKVRSVYIGAGYIAYQYARMTERKARNRKADLQARRNLERNLQDIETIMSENEQHLNKSTAAILTAAGYHYQKNEWRKKQ